MWKQTQRGVVELGRRFLFGVLGTFFSVVFFRDEVERERVRNLNKI